ncbi:hypothetical protein M2G68_22210 [Vibrio vulnificus]|nr:hypothetical protein [Vibrio vulnificus]
MIFAVKVVCGKLV